MKPNIILINCDDLGYGDLGCYGSPVNATPSIDRLASGGMRFTDFYAAPLCTPSRGSLLTGCYPQRIGFGDFDGEKVLFPGHSIGLNPNEKSIADVLKQAGYSTCMIGKWHVGDQPEFLPGRFGFDEWFGMPYSNDMGISEYKPPFLYPRHMGEYTFPPLPLMRNTQIIEEQPDLCAITERYTTEAVEYIRRSASQPFFLYFAHMYVHMPLYVPERFRSASGNGAFGATVECIDWSTGVIIHELERLGLNQNTIVFFTSDNGGESRYSVASNAPLRGGKGSTWEGSVRVPMIAYWPGVIAPGSTFSGIASIMDFFPTFERLAQTKMEDGLERDGFDLYPQLTRSAPSAYQAYYYYDGNCLEAVRMGNWKLHIEKRELYDLAADIGETANVYGERMDIVDSFQEAIARCRYALGDEILGIQGSECRKIGRVPTGVQLTEFNVNSPYFIGMYEFGRGVEKPRYRVS